MKAIRDIRDDRLQKINGGGVGDLELGMDKRLSAVPRPAVKRDPLVDRFGIRDRIFGV